MYLPAFISELVKPNLYTTVFAAAMISSSVAGWGAPFSVEKVLRLVDMADASGRSFVHSISMAYNASSPIIWLFKTYAKQRNGMVR